MSYTLSVTLEAAPEEADALVRAALKDEGFGILSEIDVQAALRDKLGHEIDAYRILGACSPPLAKQAIEADPDVGALLPCNVLLRANAAGGTDVVAADPLAMMALAGETLVGVATEARARLERALAALSGAQGAA